MSRVRFNRPCSRIRSSAGVTSSASCSFFFWPNNAAGTASAKAATGPTHNSERLDLSTSSSIEDLLRASILAATGQERPCGKIGTEGYNFLSKERSHVSAQSVLIRSGRHACRVRGGG